MLAYKPYYPRHIVFIIYFFPASLDLFTDVHYRYLNLKFPENKCLPSSMGQW